MHTQLSSFGSSGLDKLLGGNGNDIYVVNCSGDVVTELHNDDNDGVRSSIGYMLGDSCREP